MQTCFLAGCPEKGCTRWGVLQPVERFHPILCTNWATYRPHIHLPWADEQILQSSGAKRNWRRSKQLVGSYSETSRRIRGHVGIILVQCRLDCCARCWRQMTALSLHLVAMTSVALLPISVRGFLWSTSNWSCWNITCICD